MIRAVERALSVLETFDNDHLDLSLQEISERIKIAKATTFRLVNTLEAAGYLVHTESRRYCLAPKLQVLAGRVPGNFAIRDLARTLMRQLSDHTGETITLNTADGPNRVCIDVVDTPSPLMSIARPGETTPLVLGATGRVLLAYMDEDRLREAVRDFESEKSFDLVALQRELARFRQQGYAITRGQRVPGITAIAAPIFDGDGNVTHCIALTGPSIRVDPSETEFIEEVVETSRKISRQLGNPVKDAEKESPTAAPARKRIAKPRSGSNSSTDTSGKKVAAGTTRRGRPRKRKSA